MHSFIRKLQKVNTRILYLSGLILLFVCAVLCGAPSAPLPPSLRHVGMVGGDLFWISIEFQRLLAVSTAQLQSFGKSGGEHQHRFFTQVWVHFLCPGIEFVGLVLWSGRHIHRGTGWNAICTYLTCVGLLITDSPDMPCWSGHHIHHGPSW